MQNAITQCADALKLIHAYLLGHQQNGAYDLWLDRYSKAPGDHADKFLFGKLVQAMFSGGIKGQVVDAWMPRMENVFHHWDFHRIANMNTEELATVAASGEVIANLPKLSAVVRNAVTAVSLSRQFGSFGNYLASVPRISDLSRDMAHRFQYLGKITTEDFLRNVGFDTVKPDRHITRWLTRMGALSAQATSDDILETIRAIADTSKMTKPKVDAIVYLFCADRDDVLPRGVCGNVPACNRCPLEKLCPRIGLR